MKTRYHTKYSAKYLVFPPTFRAISRKIDYLWDSVRCRSYSRYKNKASDSQWLIQYSKWFWWLVRLLLAKDYSPEYSSGDLRICKSTADLHKKSSYKRKGFKNTFAYVLYNVYVGCLLPIVLIWWAYSPSKRRSIITFSKFLGPLTNVT